MAKRKRLTPVQLDVPADLETKALHNGWAGLRRPSAPIADVAGQTASTAAFEEVAQELASARREGRLIQTLPIAAIALDHLIRDRLVLDDEDMNALRTSLATRGQQTPIEVVQLGDGSYGLISGLRRIQALKSLNEPRVLALIRTPDSAADAYVAMIEENEIRAGISFYERARLAAQAADIGVYPTLQAAVAGLFSTAAGPKRSKIVKFVSLFRHLDSVLAFPTHIPEKLGLALATQLESDPDFAQRLKNNLRKAPAQDAAAERTRLEKALRKATGAPTPAPQRVRMNADLDLVRKADQVILKGAAVDETLIADLQAWLTARFTVSNK